MVQAPGLLHYSASLTVAVAMHMKYLPRTPLCCILQTNQVGYIKKFKAQLPGINGNVNQPRPQAMPSGLILHATGL